MSHLLQLRIEQEIPVSKHNPFQQFRSRDTWCTSCWDEFTCQAVSKKKGEQKLIHALVFAESINVVVSATSISILVVRDVIDLVLFQESLVDNPRSLSHDLVDPSTMSDTFQSRIVLIKDIQRESGAYRSA